MRMVIAALLLLIGTSEALVQTPKELLDPVRIQKAAQELTLYTRSGEICGFPNHPGAKVYYSFLRTVNNQATELGIESAILMVDGMIARHGKSHVCAEAAPTRPGMERLLSSLN